MFYAKQIYALPKILTDERKEKQMGCVDEYLLLRYFIQKNVFVLKSRNSPLELVVVVIGRTVEVKLICKWTSCCFEQEVVWLHRW